MARTRVPVAGTIGKSIKTVSSATDLTALTAAVAVLQQQVANLVAVATANPSGLSPTDWSLITGTPPDVKNRPPGSEGEPGPEGERGPPGLQGAIGLKGDRGSPGDDGVPGDDGPPGIPGPAGPAGVGSQGPLGNPGMDGNDGLDGNDGPPGIQGIQGTTGSAGPQGAPGIDGNDGLDGNDGPPGAQGPQGATGSAGPQGAPGMDGNDGLDGNDGPPGMQGVQGVQGTTGGLGPQGVATYLEAEPGLDGNDGPPGPQGIQGTTGGQGPQGNPGFEGDIGEPGDVGPPGPVGPVGPQGATGATGNAIYQITFGEDGGAGEPDFPPPPAGFGDVVRVTGTQMQVVTAEASQTLMAFFALGQASNSRAWSWRFGGGADLILSAADDNGAQVSAGIGIQLTRSGTSLTAVNFGNATANSTFTFNGTGAGAVSGPWTFTATPTVKGDAVLLLFRNTAATAVLEIGTVNGWNGGSATDAAIGAVANLNFYAANTGTLRMQIASGGDNFYNALTGKTHQFQINSAEAITINGAVTFGTNTFNTGTGTTNFPGAAGATILRWLPVLFAGTQYYIPLAR